MTLVMWTTTVRQPNAGITHLNIPRPIHKKAPTNLRQLQEPHIVAKPHITNPNRLMALHPVALAVSATTSSAYRPRPSPREPITSVRACAGPERRPSAVDGVMTGLRRGRRGAARRRRLARRADAHGRPARERSGRDAGRSLQPGNGAGVGWETPPPAPKVERDTATPRKGSRTHGRRLTRGRRGRAESGCCTRGRTW